MRCRRGKPSLAVLGLYNLEIGAREQVPQDLPIVLLILDHQDALVLMVVPLGPRPAPEA